MDTTGHRRRPRPPNDPRFPDHDPEPDGHPGYDERDSGVAIDGGEAFQAFGKFRFYERQSRWDWKDG